MIDLRPYSDLDAHAVLSRLDPADRAEAELTSGRAASGLGLFADWRAVQAVAAVAHVAVHRQRPFAVFCVIPTGTAGVAQAALLARDHVRFRRPLAELAVALRRAFPGRCRDMGVRRLEARCWAGHPSAAGLLAALGFRPEAILPGFGPQGRHSFIQFAWIDPDCLAPPHPQTEDI